MKLQAISGNKHPIPDTHFNIYRSSEGKKLVVHVCRREMYLVGLVYLVETI